jgi:hypothetical protein
MQPSREPKAEEAGQTKTIKLAELKAEALRLVAIIDEGQAGCASWWMMVRSSIERVHALTSRALGKE